MPAVSQHDKELILIELYGKSVLHALAIAVVLSGHM